MAPPHAADERFAAFIEAASDAIIVVDAAERIHLFNPAAEELFEVPAERALGSHLAALVPERLRAAHQAGFRRFAEGGGQRIQLRGPRLRARRADGTEFPFEASVSRIHDGGERFLVMLRDVTAETLAREQIERSLSVMQATLDAASEGILVTDLEGNVAGRNDRFLEMWGLPRPAVPFEPHGDTLGRLLAQLRDPDAFLARMRDVRDEGADEAFDVLELLDGRVVERRSRPHRLEGRMVGRVWTFRDVTAQHRDREALARSEASFRDFVEHSPYAIYRAGRDGAVLAANPAMVRLLGYESEAALLGVNLRRDVYVIEPGQRPTLAYEHPDGLETRWRRRDGSVIWVRISGLVVEDPARGLAYFEGFVADVTPLREAEHARRQAERLAAVGQLVSGVAHELNNPLSAILSFAEDLLQDPRSASDAEAIGMIHAQAQRSRAIVRDLLSFVRSRAGEREALDMAEVVDGVVRTLRPEAARLGVALAVRTEGARVTIVAERAGIEQVLTNLVMNGAQAAGSGGHVSVIVSCTESPRACEVRVVDDGPGIPTPIMPRIFDPFFTTKPTGAGTGLGLSVSLGIVEQHGGTLTAENLPQAGACFTVRMPRAAAGVVPTPAVRPTPPTATAAVSAAPPAPPEAPSTAFAAAAAAAAAVAAANAVTPRALVIDDEATIRAALRRFFMRRGWAVDEAEDGGAALTRLLAPDAPVYRAVISDLRMPGLSGMELHDRLAEVRPDLLARLVFSTGDVVSPEAADFVKRTRCPVLQKPFELSRLVEILQGFSA